MTMIEKVARAICAKEEPDGLGDWNAYVDHARAAIEAMMEPTEDMLMAGRDVGVVNETQDIYTTMVQAALKEGK